MEAQNDPEIISVTFSILNRTFVLSCRKEQKQDMERAIEHVKKTAADFLAANPNCSPLDAAIFSAVHSEHRLLAYQTHKGPFITRAERLIAEIESNTGKLIDG